jgi:hypothetical protein
MSPRPALRRPARGALVRVAILAISCACVSCDRAGRGPAAASRQTTTATAPGSAAATHTFPDITCVDAAESDGAVHLLLGRPAGADGKALSFLHTRSDDAGATWSEPVEVPTAHAPPTKMHRGDDPQVAVHGKRVMALWTARGSGPFGSGPIATALSDDGGRTWRAGPAPAADALPASLLPRTVIPAASASASPKKPPAANGTGPGYRFPSAAAGPDGFHVVWIHAVGEERSLRYAKLGDGAAQWSPAAVVDPDICACCWNELRVNADGTLLALYRDQQPSDMSVAVSRDGGATWTGAGRAGEFDWLFDGCPHVGGGLAAFPGSGGKPDALLATVWTGAPKTTGAYVLRRTPSGEWSAPQPLAADGARGRNTDVAALAERGAAAAVWDQSAEGGQAVYAALSSDSGLQWSNPRRLSPPEQNAAYPRIIPSGGRFVVLWTVYGTDGAASLFVTTLPPA